MNTTTLNHDEQLKLKLDAIHRQVSKRFKFWRDRGEQWTMPPEDYDGSQTITDDCDGFCLACRVLLRKAGIPSRLVYCEHSRGGHLVVEVQGWILDNRENSVRANTSFTDYRFLRISGYEPGDPWRLIEGF